MDVIEWIGKVAVFLGSWSAGGWVGGLIFNAIRKLVDVRHDLIVARLLYARGNVTRVGMSADYATGSRASIDASIMRLCNRGLVERKFVGECGVPYFELTPEGATILADE